MSGLGQIITRLSPSRTADLASISASDLLSQRRPERSPAEGARGSIEGAIRTPACCLDFAPSGVNFDLDGDFYNGLEGEALN